MDVPVFTYYADPLADGTIRASDETCTACGRPRGLIATSLLYTADPEGHGAFCPWCIADGTAAGRFDGMFNEVEPGATPEATEEVERRTPSFETWQDWAWPVHCGDVTVYLGQPRGDELPAEATESLVSAGLAAEHVRDLAPGRSATAYLFRCRACGSHLARWDAD